MTRPDGPGSLSPRPTSWPAWRGAVLSLLLHGAVVALLLSGRLELGEPLPESPPTPVEIIFGAEPEQQAQAEPAPPDPPAPDTAEAEPQPDLAIEEAAEEPDVAEPAEPDPAGREAAEAEPQPEAPIEASTEEPDVAEASDRPGPEPETAEEIEPEAAPLPELAEAPIPKLRPEIAAPALPPLPLRKPDLALEPEQPEAPTTPEPDTAGEEPGPPRPAYTSRDQVGAVTPQALLANLAELRDEAAQARKNPALWEVIRAVRAQMRRCWQYGPEERIDPKLSVDIRVAFERSGAVRKAEVQEVSRMVQDEAYMNFAKRAHRALMACSPFELPGDHYAVWQAFTLRFVLRQPS